MRIRLLYFLLLQLLSLSSQGQSSLLRNFQESGGTISTGNKGTIASFGNGDILIINERHTNFSRKGIQLFRLAKEGLTILNSRAYFNDFTVTDPSVAIRNDSIFVSAIHTNGGVDKLLFLLFDSDLKLLNCRLMETDWNIQTQDIYADSDGSLRVYGYAPKSGSSEIKKYVASIHPNGTLNWANLYGESGDFNGGSAFVANGDLVVGDNQAFFAVNRNGTVSWSKGFGQEWTYTIKGSRYNPGEAMMFRTGLDSGLYYGIRLGLGGSVGGQTIGVWCNSPKFSATLPNGHSLLGSSSFAGARVHIKLSEFDETGRFVTNYLVDNIYGYAPTGALYDVNNYKVHVDPQGNFYLLGVANRQGFFVLRLNASMSFECGYESNGTNPSPIAELSDKSIDVQALSMQNVNYTFTEEPPGNYKPVCMSCGTGLNAILSDTTVCLDKLPYVLNAGNDGARYLWQDGSTERTLNINSSGTYWVRLSNDCDTLVDSVTVNLNLRPQVQLSFSPDEPLPGETIQVVATPDTFTFMNWFAMDTLFAQGANFSWTSDANGVYNFIWEVFDDPSCRTRDSISIKISLVDYYFPTAFSPNGNDLNDTWGPVGSGIETYTVRIFNRWGQIIYEGENRNWDGTFKGKPIASGLYSYIVELNDSDGIRHEHRGTITLLH